MKKYRLSILDCPWDYDNKQKNDPARGGIRYPTLTMQELYDLPLGDCMEKDSGIVVWCTSPKLCDSHYNKLAPLNIIQKWGYRPVTFLFVWVKTNKNAIVPDLDSDDMSVLENYDEFYSGLGRYTNSNIEFAIYARRGEGVGRVEKDVKQLICSPIGIHSAKPREQYNRLQRLFGDVPRIEFFARKINPPPDGWEATGYDWDGVDIRDFLKQYKTEA